MSDSESEFDDGGSDMSLFDEQNDSSSDFEIEEDDEEVENDLNEEGVERGPWITVHDPDVYERPLELENFNHHTGPVNPPPINYRAVLGS